MLKRFFYIVTLILVLVTTALSIQATTIVPQFLLLLSGESSQVEVSGSSFDQVQLDMVTLE